MADEYKYDAERCIKNAAIIAAGLRACIGFADKSEVIAGTAFRDALAIERLAALVDADPFRMDVHNVP